MSITAEKIEEALAYLESEYSIKECCGHPVGGNGPEDEPACCAQPDLYLRSDKVKETILSLLQQGEPEGFVRVPKAALDWLNGSGPDHEGKWFGEVEDALPQSKHPRKYFWRSHFRKICNAITGALLNAKCVLNSAAPEQHGKDRG